MAGVKIGIPRGLLFHKYGVLWKSFFEKLGCEVLVSPDTNKEILTKGSKLAVDENCLSVKIYLGHVDYLKDKVDYMFIPHIVSVKRGEELCVKFVALRDMVANTFPDLKIIDCTIDVEERKPPVLGFFKAGWSIVKNPGKILLAYWQASSAQKQHEKKLIKSQADIVENADKENPTVLVVSHPYTTHDAFLGEPIVDFLKSQGVNLLFSDAVGNQESRELSKKISDSLYWTYSKEQVGAIEMYKKIIDGVIFLMTFPCGPDALVINLCQNKLKIPITVLVLDEHQGEAGLKTRLESFVDVLKIKAKNKYLCPTEG